MLSLSHSTAASSAPALGVSSLNYPHDGYLPLSPLLYSSAPKAYKMTEPLQGRHQVVYSPPPPSTPTTWAPTSQRVGVVALKAGMTADWDKWGVRHPLTVLRVEDVIVTGHATVDKRGYTALQLGAGVPSPLRVPRSMAGYFATQAVAPRRELSEFRVTPDAMLPLGTPILARHFVPGQMVKVTSVSQGKGFQGAMKRHGFAGQGASHGNSVSHRVLGATGCRQDPGKVIKGKKMPGHMGEKTISMDLQVFKVDIKANLLYLKGAVPGKPGTSIRVVDSIKSPHKAPPPFPTYTLSPEDLHQLEKWAAGAYLTPMEELELKLKGAIPKGECGKGPSFLFGFKCRRRTPLSFLFPASSLFTYTHTHNTSHRL